MIFRQRSDPSARQDNLPFLVWVVVISTLLADVGGEGILGYQFSALGWLIPLIFALWSLARGLGGFSYPLWIWLPWCCFVVVYTAVSDEPNAIQRSIMMLCPLVVGMAISKAQIGKDALVALRKLMLYMAIGLIVLVAFKTGIIFTGVLPMITGLAAEVMTAAMLCNYFAAQYVFGDRKILKWWAILAAIPVIAVTRTAIAVNGLTLPLTFAPLATLKRAIIFFLIIIIGIGIFYSPRMQKKMFYSGRGTLEDVKWENEDFATTGRSYMWSKMWERIDEQPLLGYGANASESFISKLTRGLKHPHNDWLRLLFDFGYIGVIIFALSLLMQALHAYRRAKQTFGDISLLFYAGASSILSFVLFMFTDNILLYAAFFGNLQFMILGLAYAAQATAMEEEQENRRLEALISTSVTS
ncbi:o-antigen polymerase [hydrocarbon metagenome]|uniref:O-antigen polymerase n=1 Tax=hydrocarbon metagenome TaxID=938273 RepID=A0A0W8FPS4_9ZZZZ